MISGSSKLARSNIGGEMRPKAAALQNLPAQTEKARGILFLCLFKGEVCPLLAAIRKSQN